MPTPETAIKRQIKDWLNAKRIHWWYNLAGIGAQKGIPDLFALHKGTLYAIEVKTPKGRLSEHQEEFLKEIEKAGGVPVVARSYEDVEFAIK